MKLLGIFKKIRSWFRGEPSQTSIDPELDRELKAIAERAKGCMGNIAMPAPKRPESGLRGALIRLWYGSGI